MPSPYEQQIGFTRAKRVGNVIAVSGTASLGDDGKVVGRGDCYAQTRRCLEIVVAAVRANGGALETITRTRIMLVDINLWQHAARAHAEVFAAAAPACTFVEVTRFIEQSWLVEIEADAVVDQR
jgi:enamine deaminase RidA (YjgF/YER057c/UK114 family)